MMSDRPKNPANARNKNVLVVGGSGSGKTRFFIKPNLMQMHSSYVVTDPKGTVLIEVGKLLSRGTPKLDKDGKPVRGKNGKIVYEPYKIKVFNTINFSKSMHYNPFAYIHNEKDILKLVTVLIANTKGEGKSGDDFWVKAETLLYTALIGYIYYEAPSNEQNFSTLVEMINAMEVREDDETFKNAVDLPRLTLRKSGRSPCMTSWNLTWWATGKRRCSLLSVIRTRPLISLSVWLIPSYSTCSVSGRMINLVAGSRSMCGA